MDLGNLQQKPNNKLLLLIDSRTMLLSISVLAASPSKLATHKKFNELFWMESSVEGSHAMLFGGVVRVWWMARLSGL